MYNKLAIVSIPVKNQSAAKAFYTEVLGGHVIEEMPLGPGTQWAGGDLPRPGWQWLGPATTGRDGITKPLPISVGS